MVSILRAHFWLVSSLDGGHAGSYAAFGYISKRITRAYKPMNLASTLNGDWITRLRQAPGLRYIDDNIFAVRCAWRRMMSRLFLKRLVREAAQVGRGAPDELFQLTRQGFFGAIYPVQNREEIVPLLELVRTENPHRVLEIGTATGGTLFLFTRMAADDATIVSIDLPGGPGGGGYPAWLIPLYRAFALPGQRIELIRDDSHNAHSRDLAAQFFDHQQVDVLFLDGDHSYEGVKRDFEMYSSLVRPGGIIAFHDTIVAGGVRKFWAELKTSGLACEELVADHGKIFGIGVVRKP
jgi:predicted O-methyltransferase YrrM